MSARYSNNSQLTKPLPEKLPCNRCGILLAHTAFAKSRRNSAIWLNTRQGNGLSEAAKNVLVCLRCNGAPPTELFCTRCSLIKGLDQFSGAQRSNPDGARCKACMHVHEHKDLPGKMHDSDDDDDDDDDEDDDVDDEPGGLMLPPRHGSSVLSRDDDDEYQVTQPGVSRPQSLVNRSSTGLSVVNDPKSRFPRVKPTGQLRPPSPQKDDGHARALGHDGDDDWDM